MVMAPSIRLEALDDAAHVALERAGLTLARWDGQPAIHFAESSGDIFDNPSFIDALGRLNQAGFCFGEDYKQGWAPADLMRELQSRGRITVPFTAIAWEGPDDWVTTLHVPGQPPRRTTRAADMTAAPAGRPRGLGVWLLVGIVFIATGLWLRPEPLPEQTRFSGTWTWVLMIGVVTILVAAWRRFGRPRP
jgi:hypothetical protein